MPLLEWIAVHWVAAILLLVYVAMLMYNALLGQRASDSISGYYLGGRRLGGFTIGVSFFATIKSTAVHHHATNDHAMATEKLSSRMHHQVGT